MVFRAAVVEKSCSPGICRGRFKEWLGYLRVLPPSTSREEPDGWTLGKELLLILGVMNSKRLWTWTRSRETVKYDMPSSTCSRRPCKGVPARCSVTRGGGGPARRAKKILFLQQYVPIFNPYCKASRLPRRLLRLWVWFLRNENDFFKIYHSEPQFCRARNDTAQGNTLRRWFILPLTFSMQNTLHLIDFTVILIISF